MGTLLGRKRSGVVPMAGWRCTTCRVRPGLQRPVWRQLQTSKAVAPVLPNALARPASRRRQRTIGRHAGMAGLALEAIGLPIALFRLGRVPFLHAASVDIMDVR